MEEISKLLQKNERIIWSGNNKRYLKRAQLEFIPIDILLLFFFVNNLFGDIIDQEFQSILILDLLLLTCQMLFLAIISLAIIFLIEAVCVYFFPILDLSYYGITNVRIIEKRKKKVRDFSLKQVLEFEIKRKSFGERIVFYWLTEEHQIKITLVSNETGKSIQGLLRELIPCKGEIKRKGMKYKNKEAYKF